ncbi:MAG: GntR family transcriptional regulator [Thermoleophilia bacterium]|nr:GntR family transcriptional regulator [Thermoleophilia bacterium]
MRWTVDHRSRERLRDQIAARVRRGAASGELAPGERLPPAAELGEALSVDRNTVLAAYRQLRDEGVLEFRRGRGARLAADGPELASVTEAARALIAAARAQGLGTADLIRLIREMS